MNCPFCAFEESKVIDSRPTDDGGSIRRRRECLSCKMRFTTYETIERMPIMVIKKDNTRQPFDRTKLLNGLVRACVKRPIPISTLEEMVDDIEQSIINSSRREVSAQYIGELALEKLRGLDEVAYVRFASVYREFKDAESFVELLPKLRQSKF